MGCHIANHIGNADNNQNDGIHQTGDDEKRCPVWHKTQTKQQHGKDKKFQLVKCIK